MNKKANGRTGVCFYFFVYFFPLALQRHHTQRSCMLMLLLFLRLENYQRWRLAGWMKRWIAGWLTDWLVGCLTGWLAEWLDGVWLAEWMAWVWLTFLAGGGLVVSWLVSGRLDGWLDGWLDGCS